MINSLSSEDLEEIFTKADPNLFSIYEKGVKSGYDVDYEYSICLSNIFSRLIQDAGRFCDRFASDVLFAIDAIKKMADDVHANEILLVGIRDGSVDMTSFIAENLLGKCWQPYYYRRIYGVKISHTPDDVSVEMRDVKSAIDIFAHRRNA